MPSTGMITLCLHDALPISFAGRRLSESGGVAEAEVSAGPKARQTVVERHRAKRLERRRANLRPDADAVAPAHPTAGPGTLARRDRKSTRLNSSHTVISYAVHRHDHSLPTRRSSDLVRGAAVIRVRGSGGG